MACRDASPYAVIVWSSSTGIQVYSCGCTIPHVSIEDRRKLWAECGQKVTV